MKENIGHLLLATVLILASLLPNVAPYPLQEPNEASSLAQTNSETEIKEPHYILPQSNMDARYDDH